MMEDRSFSRDERGEIVRAPETIGSPVEDAMHTLGPQERVDTCAIRSQQHILSMYGIDIPEAELVQDAIKHDEYSMSDTNGTSIDDVGNLLERQGIDVNRYDNATVAHLISELGPGHKIIVGIDAYEAIADSLPERLVEMQKDAVMERANHAVLVVDVDPRTLDVAIIDPADGCLHSVPVGRFIDAWQDSDCFMMATKESPEEFIAKSGSELGGTTMMHDFDKHDFPMGHVAGVDPQDMDVNQPRLGSLGQVVGAAPGLGGLGHVAGVASQDMDVNQPRLGSLGQVVGAAPGLGGLGHVAGVASQDMDVNQPRLGSLGQVAGIAPRLGSLGQVAGFATDETNSLLSGVGILGSQEVVALDLTGNGDVDALVFDTDGNGTLDALALDTTGDGSVDMLAFDTDNNGMPDAFALDTNGDGALDTFATSVDLNGDGIPDLIGVDLNSDGIIDCTVDPDDFSTEY